MLGYLICDNGLSKIVLADASPQEMATPFKPLIECNDEDLSGFPVFQNAQFIGHWPNQDSPFEKSLIKALALQLKTTGFDKLQNILEETIYNKASTFLCSRCPDIELKISTSRSLCLTIIPKRQSNYINGISDYDEAWEIRKYITKPSLINKLIPHHALPFAKVDFDSVVLSVCEYVDLQYETALCSYLQTPDEVKKNFVDPCLTIIKLLHSKNYQHGDLTDSNLTLSIKFNKLIFIDFKNVMPIPSEAKRLEDLRDVAHTIYSLSPSQFKNTPALIYLFILQEDLTKLLNDNEDSNDPAVFKAYKKLSI